MRYPAVAGAFYERSREALLRQIRECYTHPLGPGRVPQVQRAERRIVGLVVPHAGYAYSGPIAAHRYEHSIEVQLPFLQQLHESVRFVPICMAFQEYELASEVGRLVADAVSGTDVTLIASSDFTHVGAQYNQLPTRGLTAPAFAKEQDAKAIEKILVLDAQAFAGKVTQAEISMCGYGPVTAMLTAAKQLGAKGATLLKYGTSSDVSHDANMAVGYGAIAVFRCTVSASIQ